MEQIINTHTVEPGETLGQIARNNQLGLNELLEANPQIRDPNLIQIGQVIAIPGSIPSPIPQPAIGHSVIYDGIHPAPGTMGPNQDKYVNPPLTNAPGNRNPDTYAQVIDQFAVKNNPRYLFPTGFTYCNIFMWDVTRAMDVEIPHWIGPGGSIAVPFSPGALCSLINGSIDWLRFYGPAYGWQPVMENQAQDNANLGNVSVAVWKNPTGGHGHTAVIRPGFVTPRGVTIAQAGSTNFGIGHLVDGFGTKVGIEYYIHS